MIILGDILGSINENSLKQAISLVKQMIGEKEAARLEQQFAAKNGAQNLAKGLTADELVMIKTVIENPELLRRVLSTPKGKEAITKLAGS